MADCHCLQKFSFQWLTNRLDPPRRIVYNLSVYNCRRSQLKTCFPKRKFAQERRVDAKDARTPSSVSVSCVTSCSFSVAILRPRQSSCETVINSPPASRSLQLFVQSRNLKSAGHSPVTIPHQKPYVLQQSRSSIVTRSGDVFITKNIFCPAPHRKCQTNPRRSFFCPNLSVTK